MDKFLSTLMETITGTKIRTNKMGLIYTQMHFRLLLIMEANTMNPYQTAPKRAVWSGSILFASKASKVYKQISEQTPIVDIAVKTLCSRNWHVKKPVSDDIQKLKPCSTVCNMSDCRSRGHKFDPGPVPYFCGEIISTASLLPSADSRRVVVSYKQKHVYSESMCTKYWLIT